MSSMDKTMRFNFSEEPFDQDVRSVLLSVHSALQEKGYNPINQIVGYLLSGDPAYIPRHQDARNLIRKLERDELIEELVKFYLKENKNKEGVE
ncbi:IreB family regulatory phosphoprotein [Halobacillus rhizosphaerae]|uniref:IreB family regulatory phosphoprotein n=1 Tax=Halobacillus rhizosphaerae TaxID=3064889 RepID=UPI00398BB9BC